MRTPMRVGSEASRVEVNLTVQADGSGSGSVRWQWSGEGANALLEALAVRGRVRVEASVLSALGGFLPGAQLGAVAIHEDEGALPRLRIEGAFTLRQAVQGTGERRSLLVPQQPSLPSPWTLEDRAVPVVVEPVQEEVVWTIQVPAEWCLPAAEDEQVVNAVGSYRRRLDAGPSQLVLRRSLELGKRVVAVTEVPALRELAVAEQRGNQRRVRFGCQPGVTPAE